MKYNMLCEICKETVNTEVAHKHTNTEQEGNTTLLNHIFICELCVENESKVEETEDGEELVFVTHEGKKYYDTEGN